MEVAAACSTDNASVWLCLRLLLLCFFYLSWSWLVSEWSWVENSHLNFWSQIRQDYPLNLSISVSGGKETNKDSLSNGEWSGKSSNFKSERFPLWIVVWRSVFCGRASPSLLEWSIREGENPVLGSARVTLRLHFEESSCLGMQLKVGGKFHPRLNIGRRPIANKYREGKMKSTLKRELNSTWNC